MMKRLVVLQDEQFILQELGRLTAERRPTPPAAAPADRGGTDRRRAAPAAPVAAAPARQRRDRSPAATTATTTAAATPTRCRPRRPTASTCTSWRGPRPWRPSARPSTGRSTRFRWNRRKTAAYLKVSYKTLLNKMKECGIRGAELA